MTENLYELKKSLEKNRFILCYSGDISQDMIEAIGEAVKERVELVSSSVTTTQKVFGIFVEQVQNMMHYSAESAVDEATQVEARSGVVGIGQDEDVFFVESGNLVQNEHVPEIERRITELQGKDKAELKALFKERIKRPPEGQSRGAGVGFIDIARKSSRPVEFDIRRVDDQYSFFSLRAFIEM